MRTRSPERRVAILNAAAAVFSELGVEKAKISDVVERIGGSKSTIYSYFPSKEALLAAVVARASEDLIQRAFHDLEADVPLAAGLGSFGQNYLASLLTPEMVSMRRIAQQQAEQHKAGETFYEGGPLQGWRLMADQLQKRMARGEIREADPWIAAMHLKGLLQAQYLDEVLLGRELPSPQRIGESALLAVEVFLRGYRPD